jgi:hypothetical protein
VTQKGRVDDRGERERLMGRKESKETNEDHHIICLVRHKPENLAGNGQRVA